MSESHLSIVDIHSRLVNINKARIRILKTYEGFPIYRRFDNDTLDFLIDRKGIAPLLHRVPCHTPLLKILLVCAHDALCESQPEYILVDALFSYKEIKKLNALEFELKKELIIKSTKSDKN
jgi:hypothetical protein